MKFNFRKIASVLASAVMIGSTVGIAAAANYPAPFTTGDVAIVYTSGTHTGGASDAAAAIKVQTNLASKTTASTSTTASTATGESLKIEKGTNKLNMNNALTDIWTTKITKSDLPTLLADKTFTSKDNIEYKYEQYVQFNDYINFTHFDDDDFKKDTPSLGVKMSSSTKVMNYTLDFLKYPRSDVDSNGRLEDLEDRDVVILGKTYKLLNAYNKSSDTKLEFMRGAATDKINLNEEKTIKVGDKSYTVSLTYVDATYTQFDVTDSGGNKQTTTKLAKGGTYKLKDGTYLGVTDLSYQNFAGGVMNAEFTLGANKLVIENGQVLKIDENNQNQIKGYITRTEADANKVDIQKITLEWETDDERFIGDGKELLMPGFESLKFSYGGFTAPCEETTKVRGKGTYGIELTVPIKDGDATFSILYGNTTDFNAIAEDANNDKNLRTGTNLTGTFIVFDGDTDAYFIASWNDSTSAESYFLKASGFSEDTSTSVNKTTITNKVSGTTYEAKYDGKGTNQVITIGNVELTIGVMSYTGKSVELQINSGGTFNRIYTKGGLGIWLPVNCSDADIDCGNAADTASNWNVVYNLTDAALLNGANYMLMMSEEDKDGNLGAGAIINVTLDQASNEAEVTEIGGDTTGKGWSSGAYREVGSGTNEYEGYIASDLGTKVIFKKPTSGINTADIVYHCKESYANIFLTAPETVVGGTPIAAPVKDTEIDTVKTKNLIVVGGSCINTVARKIIDATATEAICGEEFTAKTNVGTGKFLIKAVTSPYASDKIAVLAAGYEAEQTTDAVNKLIEGHATDVGTSNIYPVTAA